MASLLQSQSANQFALDGLLAQAKQQVSDILQDADDPPDTILNNLAAIEAALGNFDQADQLFRTISTEGVNHLSTRHNLAFVQEHCSASVNRNLRSTSLTRRRIAIVSLLFNWPSTGGGTVHTKELAEFLHRAGYDIRHFYAVHEEWGLGNVPAVLPYRTTPMRFRRDEWLEEVILERFQQQVSEFAPDLVIITCSWNTKPLLAEAVAGYPYFIRIAALETICPLNNVRMLFDEQDGFSQCENNQFRTPANCLSCVTRNQHYTGGLHQLERTLGGFWSEDYPDRLHKAFSNAVGVFVVNPKIAQLIEPYTPQVHVIPSGFNSARFPKSLTTPPPERQSIQILFAGIPEEVMKGFHVLAKAGMELWQSRQDFQIVATGLPSAENQRECPFLKYVGWRSQADLPKLISDCDILVFPTIAQEALGRTAVEAMACGRPVVASKIGGLAWVVEDGITGLHCVPGDAADLTEKLERLLDDRELRIQLGANGREKFEREFTWETMITEEYRPLFGSPILEQTAAAVCN